MCDVRTPVRRPRYDMRDPSSSNQPSTTNHRPSRVVFVDDEPRVCHVVGKTLARAGVDVRCFSSADDCLRHLAAQWCDLLITDVMMPGWDGMSLLGEVRTRLPWVPVLVVTGYADVPLAVRALKAGAADFVEKPLDRDAFLQTVERLLEQSARSAAFLGESLTMTERRILYLVLEGRNSREIAEVLGRSPRTVEAHRSHLMQKLGAANIIELLLRAAELGILPN
ncbi:MAG: response regulator transcription factor, partial [Planctomycetes bacterium]|nr:response regulator transcription factor [Planctomycetota bacterium]